MALKVDYVVKETGTNLTRNVTLTLATVITIAVTLTLVGAGLVLNRGVDRATNKWKGGVQFIVFMDPEATPAQTDVVKRDLGENPQVKSFTYFDHEAAFKEFKTLFSKNPEVVQSIKPEELPTSYRVAPEEADARVVSSLVAEFRKKPGVFQVVAATDTIKAMQRMTDRVSQFVTAGAALLGIGALVLIVNTIRMAMFARRREIEVMKLVGATNWFIRVPFMAEGLVQGLAGGLVGVGLVVMVNKFLFQDLFGRSGDLTLLQNFVIGTGELWSISTWLVVAGCFVGIAGSGVAVTRFLDV